MTKEVQAIIKLTEVMLDLTVKVEKLEDTVSSLVLLMTEGKGEA